MGAAVNIFTMLDRAATRYPDEGALYLGDRCVVSWRELRERALRLAASIRRSAAPGTRVAVASENRPEIVELMFGIWAAGCVFVPMNFKLHPREMADILSDCEAALVVASPKLATALAAHTGIAIDVLDSPAYRDRFDCPPMSPADVAPDALAWLFYTSGTTGRSKGAMLSHRNLTAMTVAHLADIDDPDQGCSLVHAAPMSHGSGLYIPAYVLRGARQVVPASGAFDADEFLDLCAAHPGCTAFLAPTMVQRLVDTGRSAPDALRSIIYGGGPMYVESLKQALAAFGPIFAQIYGQGESPMTITGLRRADHECGDDAILGSVGDARSGVEVAVLRPDGTRADPHEIGEIVCRGDVVMTGYWNNPAATAETLAGGWLHTGDLGSFDEHGYLTLRDRSKDVVISGGSNVYPREVEEVLLEHPGVREACVVGTPDAEWGEAVVAFIVGEADPRSLDAYLLERIARFKRPKRYLFVEDLPKNSYGKVLKRALRARLSSEPVTGPNT